MPFDLKDFFQFGVPTGLLCLILYKGPGAIERLSVPFLTAIREGFVKIESAVRESNSHWQSTLETLHRENRQQIEAMHQENREDIAKDRELRHATNSIMQAALSTINEQSTRLKVQTGGN